ncbi:hypothetical protein ACOTW8_22330, partial [Enterobacter cloacae complex sp. IR5374]|uniref:hypothetical protein n=1 Tax=Enterobacter cloacae complex sp. IR5374 TaxID=3412347 RepID=UPI003B9F3CB8
LKIYSHMVTLWGNYEGISQCQAGFNSLAGEKTLHFFKFAASRQHIEDMLFETVVIFGHLFLHHLCTWLFQAGLPDHTRYPYAFGPSLLDPDLRPLPD